MVIGQPKHKDCANFKDGKCLLYGVTVPPDGPACPNFVPRTQATTPRVTTPAPAGPAAGIPYAAPSRWGYGPGRGWGAGRGMSMGLGLRMRRRHRHGRGRRHWSW